MGWFYGAAIHVNNKSAAGNLAAKYTGQTFVFNNHDIGRLGAGSDETDGEFWCEIVCEQITKSGIANREEAVKADEFCNIMYGMLRNDEYFNFALLGVEVWQCRTLKEIEEELATRDYANLDGLVVSKVLWEKHGKPEGFVEFSKSHVWLPKKEEKSSEERRNQVDTVSSP